MWIPVDDINDMVMCSSNSGSSVCNLELDGETLKCATHSATATDLVGRLYTSTNFNDKSQSYNSEYKEPAVASTDQSNNITIESMKSDFTAMATSVAKNGGFYVSRYEIGANASSKKMQTVLTAGTNNGGAGNWYGLYNACKDLNENRQMIWGCQYDQMIKFIGEQAQIGHSDRNLTKTQALSGQNELDKMNNIYDLEGNSLEWILESRENYRTERGNSFLEASIGTYNPASSRTYNHPGAGWVAASTRSTLYIGIEEEQISEPISKTQSYVGYYADVDGDKQPDGIIYADLAFSKSGQWSTNNGAYSYYSIADTKDYYICQTNYEGPFGTKDVLTLIEGEGADRFYVMSLEDFNTGTNYCWYDGAYGAISDYSTVTSLNFGTGKSNTAKMIAKWNSGAYGAKNDGSAPDIWGVIQEKVAEGWFVPSRGEWGAFGDNLKITSSNYKDYELYDTYWSSSLYDASYAWYIGFSLENMAGFYVTSTNRTRLSITF